MIRDTGTMVPAKSVDHQMQNRIPFIPCEIDVYIGRIGSSHGEKPFEIEVVGYWIDVRDPQCVRNGRCGTGTSPAGTAGQRDYIVHNKEIGGEALFFNDIQFVLNPLKNSVGELSIANFRTFEHSFAQLVGYTGLDACIGREYQFREQRDRGAEIRYGLCILDRFWPGGESRQILFMTAECAPVRFQVFLPN